MTQENHIVLGQYRVDREGNDVKTGRRWNQCLMEEGSRLVTERVNVSMDRCKCFKESGEEVAIGVK